MEAAFLISSRFSEGTTSCRLQLLLLAENAGFGRICHPEQGCPNDDVQVIPAELKGGGRFTMLLGHAGHRVGQQDRRQWW